jgi:RNA polymerase sigma factor (sigma-70 family)
MFVQGGSSYKYEVMVMESNGNDELTPREKEVLDLLAEGMTYQEIADVLVVSVHTVDSHLRNIYGKLRVRNRTKAVAKWLIRKLKR